MIARLFAQLDLDGLEQVPIENGGLLTLQHLTLEVDLSDVETIMKEVSERTTRILLRDSPNATDFLRSNVAELPKTPRKDWQSAAKGAVLSEVPGA